MSSDILKTYVFFIIDKSGSMESVKEETINIFNEQLEMLKRSQTKNMKCFVSLTMCNENVQHIFLNKNVVDVSNLEVSDFKPQGLTATFDGIHAVLNEAEKLDDISNESTSCLFIILSDGKENSSKLYSELDVATKIQSLQNTGRWTFTYIGANQDLNLVSNNLNIPKGNILKYDQNSFGLKLMISKHLKYLGSYFTARSYGTKSTRGFYGSDK